MAIRHIMLFAVSLLQCVHAVSYEMTKVVTLNQKTVAELALSQGYKTKAVNLQYKTLHLAVAQNLAIYDWTLNSDSGYQLDKSLSLLTSGQTPLNNEFQSYKTTITVSKPLTSGTTLGLELNRFSQKTNMDSIFMTPPPDNQTVDSAGITLEQSLWADFFGEADRASLKAIGRTYESQSILRANNLEEVVLEAIRQFWTTFTAQENFKEAVASRDRYKKLVDTVKKKTSLGYSNPGDLPQAQAEFEARDQAVKSASTRYLNSLENLITILNLDSKTEVKFEVGTNLPTVPNLAPKNPDDLRSIRSQKLKVESAQENLTSSQSKNHPTLNLIGKAYTTGWGENAQDSFSGVMADNHPKYYVGFKFNYHFGSDIQNEDINNKKITRDLEETNLSLQKLQSLDQQSQAERKVRETYALAFSTEKQKNFREKAVQELNRSYSQGRTDISILITAMNNFVTAELSYIEAVGNYNIALNEWAAIRDELIPDKSI